MGIYHDQVKFAALATGNQGVIVEIEKYKDNLQALYFVNEDVDESLRLIRSGSVTSEEIPKFESIYTLADKR